MSEKKYKKIDEEALMNNAFNFILKGAANKEDHMILTEEVEIMSEGICFDFGSISFLPFHPISFTIDDVVKVKDFYEKKEKYLKCAKLKDYIKVMKASEVV